MKSLAAWPRCILRHVAVDDARVIDFLGLNRTHEHSATVTVVFSNLHPRADELRRVRQTVPELGSLRPAEVVARIDQAGRIPLGVLALTEARNLQAKAQQLGVVLDVETTHRVRYIAVQRDTQMALLIEVGTACPAPPKRALYPAVRAPRLRCRRRVDHRSEIARPSRDYPAGER
jgi:hypothetical protein